MDAAIVTGAAGGIGAALCASFRAAGYRVVGVDLAEPADASADRFVVADLATCRFDELGETLRGALDGARLAALVNNAAVQRLGHVGEITDADWADTIRVNLTAPLMLTQALLPELTAAHGAVVNIGSVHAQATKAEFVAYATSKAAIHGLTRALAVDLGTKARAICVAPAAVRTPMLAAGFEGRPEAYGRLTAAHPAGRIAEPDEIARAVVSIVADPFLFGTGSTVWLDGGVLSKLHELD